MHSHLHACTPANTVMRMPIHPLHVNVQAYTRANTLICMPIHLLHVNVQASENPSADETYMSLHS